MLRPSPKFLVGAILVPQTQEFATVHANPGADPCARLIGSRGANVAPEAESHGRQKRPWRTSPWLACFVFVVCVCRIRTQSFGVCRVSVKFLVEFFVG